MAENASDRTEGTTSREGTRSKDSRVSDAKFPAIMAGTAFAVFLIIAGVMTLTTGPAEEQANAEAGMAGDSEVAADAEFGTG